MVASVEECGAEDTIGTERIHLCADLRYSNVPRHDEMSKSDRKVLTFITLERIVSVLFLLRWLALVWDDVVLIIVRNRNT